MGITDNMHKWLFYLLIFIAFVCVFFAAKFAINAWWPENIQREPWDYTVYHVYVEPVRNGSDVMNICPVTKLYTDSVCIITCPDGTIIEINIDVPNNQAIPAKHINISSELQDFNCTYSCEGKFIRYSCGGIPDEKK